MQRVPLRLKRLTPRATLPAYQTESSAGLDLAACLDAPITIQPGEIVLVPCGFAMALPHGFEGQVRPRSGLATKHGIGMPNAPGTIDADYRGELGVLLVNLGSEPFVIHHGDRVAQLVIAQVTMAEPVEVEPSHPGHDGRGAGGYGSTGGFGAHR